MGHLHGRHKIFMIAAVCVFSAAVILAITGIIASAAGGNDISYRLGSTGDITYKENDNKVYYTRKHFSSGSSIRYYTSKFVISLKEISQYDDLSALNASGNDYSMELTVAHDGGSIKEKDADKTKSFYWYDSDEADDDGYITTTYVIDGSILLEFLENASASGRRGNLYIHHVFSITGGSDNDAWHKSNNVVNNVPYFRYSDLFKLTWNNTEATRASQEACMNIPVPFKSFCEVYTAYYNEYGRVIRQERGTLSGNANWIKTVPYYINGVNGKKYASLEPGTRKDTRGNIMRAYYVYSTVPLNKTDFPLWDPGRDWLAADGNTRKLTDASGSHLIRGGYLKKTDSIYSFAVAQANAYNVILYIPVTDADNELNPGLTPDPDVTPLPDVTPGPDVTLFPDVTPIPDITQGPYPGGGDIPAYTGSELTVKYFYYDLTKGKTDCIKLERVINRESGTGRYDFNAAYTVRLQDTLYKDGRVYEPASLDGVLFGDNASLLASGSVDFVDTFNMHDEKVYGMSSGSVRREDGVYADFETGDRGGFCTVYILCNEIKATDSLLIRYIDEESREVISEQILTHFFDGKKLYWHGVNGKLSWAYRVPLTDIYTADGDECIPSFKEEGAYSVVSGKCAPYEAVHEHLGRELGNEAIWYCMTCGKIKRITYFTGSPYAPDAVTSVYDNNSVNDTYHSYRKYNESESIPVRAGYVYGSFITDADIGTGRTYQNCSDCEYDYDESNSALWIAVPGDINSGNLAFTFEPEKDVPFTAGVLYIPCRQKVTRKPIHVHISGDNLKHVQYHYADKELPQAVIINDDLSGDDNDDPSKFYLVIDEYGDDVLAEFGLDVLAPGGIRIKAGTKHIPYPSYRVPSDVQEGIYSVKAEVTDTDGSILYTDETFLEVTGRLYGLTLYDISSDGYEWKGVFNGEGNGFNTEALPLLDGDSPKVKNAGMLKSGYIWSFSLKTAGSRMQQALSGIKITPEFYHISPDGTKRKVDIWYRGYDADGRETILKEEKKPAAVRGVMSRRVGDKGDSTKGIWSFEYSLPDTWYCVEKGFDMEGYLDIYDGCTFGEAFWEKEGYLAVSFKIEAYTEDGTVIMSYSNLSENVEAGMCDMWAEEGYILKKTDVYGTEFLLDEGQVIVVRIPGSTIKKGSGVPDPPTNLKEDNMIRSGGVPYLSLPR